ncbi:MAG: IS66 family insertion sequence element accessory protein TnpA [Oceanipulchritudo sp.]
MEDAKKRKGVRHRRRSEADKLLADYRASGLTQKRWCQERGIGIASLRYWLKRERGEANGYSLVPVELEGRPCGAGVLDLQVSGLDLRVGAGSDLRALAVLLRELG